MSPKYPATAANAFISEIAPTIQNTGTPSSTFIETLQKASNNVFPTSPSGYNKVLVLFLFWKDCPPNNSVYRTEAQNLKACFEDDFGFETDLFPIPSANSRLDLLYHLQNIVRRHRDEGGLLIVYYSGCGYVDDYSGGPPALHLCASGNIDGPTLDWNLCQDFLRATTHDIWLILDTSYSGATLSSVKQRGPGAFEVLCACSSRDRTPMPGPHSFTSVLMQCLRELKNEDFTVSRLHSSMISNTQLMTLPLYANFSSRNRGSIRLSRLDARHKVPTTRKVCIDVTLGASLKGIDATKWASWISNFAPANIQRMEVLTHQSPATNPLPGFALQVYLQDSLVPHTDSWSHWFENIPENVQALSVDINEFRASGPEDSVATFVAQLNLNTAVKDALQRSSYQKVSVLPLMWEAPSPKEIDIDHKKAIEEFSDITSELSDIGDVFRRRFNFNVEPIWRIPNDKRTCQRQLGKKIQQLADGHEDQDALLIILYGGHGAETRLKKSGLWGTDLEGHSVWVATPSKDSAFVDWTSIQTRIEDANCDSLMIIDCCHSGTAARGYAQNTHEILAAAVPEAPSYSGARAYSKMLKKKLEKMPLPLTGLQLHQEILAESKKPLSQNPDAPIATPSHGWGGSSSGRPVILRPLPRLHKIDDQIITLPGAVSEKQEKANPRIFMEIELDRSGQFDVAEWEAWFKERRPPSNMYGVKFYTKEEVHIKVVTETAALRKINDRVTEAAEGTDSRA